MRIQTSIVLVPLVVASTSIASAEELAPLEQPGTVVTSFLVAAGKSHASMTDASGAKSDFDGATLVTRGSAEVFVTPVLTLGGALDVSWSRSTSNDVSNGYLLGLSPSARLGLYAPLSDRVGFWPYVSFGAMRSSGSHLDTIVTWRVGAGGRFVLRFDDRWSLVAEPIGVSYTSTDYGQSNGYALGGFLPFGFQSGLGVAVAL